MSDLESRLTQTLREGADAAPDATGLAAAARGRARRHRRTRLATSAVAAALVVAAPVGFLAWPDTGDDDRDADTAADVTEPEGLRWESWHGASVRVPDDWGYGDPSTWCADGGDVSSPVVWRAALGAVSLGIACTPVSSYGVTFQEVPEAGVEWPLVAQSNGTWPAGTFVGATSVGKVLVEVATPDEATGRAVLDSVRATGTVDPNGCASPSEAGAAAPPEGGLSVCRYDGAAELEQSEALFGQDAGEAVRAIQDAPAPEACVSKYRGPAGETVRLTAPGLSATVDLTGDCPSLTVDGERHQLTADVLYWALSPGWIGAVDAGVPLPPALRQR